MSYIEELRQRVEAAERRFGLIDEQQRRYSERLIALMNALESAQEERQSEAASHQARILELERENGELRGMLHALLLGVEAGSRDTLAGTLRDLDARLSDMVPPAATPGEAPAGIVAPDADLAAETLPTDDDLAAEDTVGPEDVTEGQDGSAADAVAAAERAVAELMDAGTEIVMEEPPSKSAAEGGPGSPVSGIIDRLAEETQDLVAAGLDPAEHETTAAAAHGTTPAPPEPARSRA